MFENQRSEDVEALLDADKDFRRLYQRHKQLDSKVHDADTGVLPIDSVTLSGLKRQKLMTKDRLERLWKDRQHPNH